MTKKETNLVKIEAFWIFGPSKTRVSILFSLPFSNIFGRYWIKRSKVKGQ